MHATYEFTLLTDDLAAHWTEPVLEIVAAAAVPCLSIDLELEAWHIVKEVLQSELQWRHAFKRATLVSLPALMDSVLRRSAEQVVLRISPQALTTALRTQLRQLAGDRRATLAERELYARIIREAWRRLAFKPPSRSDFTPRLRVAPVLA